MMILIDFSELGGLQMDNFTLEFSRLKHGHVSQLTLVLCSGSPFSLFGSSPTPWGLARANVSNTTRAKHSSGFTLDTLSLRHSFSTVGNGNW